MGAIIKTLEGDMLRPCYLSKQSRQTHCHSSNRTNAHSHAARSTGELTGAGAGTAASTSCAGSTAPTCRGSVSDREGNRSARGSRGCRRRAATATAGRRSRGAATVYKRELLALGQYTDVIALSPREIDLEARAGLAVGFVGGSDDEALLGLYVGEEGLVEVGRAGEVDELDVDGVRIGVDGGPFDSKGLCDVLNVIGRRGRDGDG